MHKFFPRFLSHQSGVALIEFAIVLPFLVTLFFAAIEITGYTLAVMRVQKSAYVLTDIIAQSTPATKDRKKGEITTTTVRDVLSKLPNVLGGADEDRVMIVTSIQRVGVGGTVVRWQQSGGGSLSKDVLSITGSGPCGGCMGVGMQPVTLTGGYDISGMMADENMIVGEVFYFYQPLFGTLLERLGVHFQPHVLHRTMFMLPRIGALPCLPEDFVYAECTV